MLQERHLKYTQEWNHLLFNRLIPFYDVFDIPATMNCSSHLLKYDNIHLKLVV